MGHDQADASRRRGFENVARPRGRGTPGAGNRKRSSRSLIPIPAGFNAGLVDHLRSQSRIFPRDFEAEQLGRRAPLMPVALDKPGCEERGVENWQLCIAAGCNLLAGYRTLLPPGEATALQRAAMDQMGSTLERSLAPHQDLRWLEKDCAQELNRTHVSYTGEEVEVAQVLTLEQMEPALPPKGFGGSVNLLDFLSPGSGSWLSAPRRLLRDPKLFEGYKFEAKLHIAENEKFLIAQSLVARGVCDWIPESEVFEHRGRKLYNGMFGVKKDSSTASGKAILRTIMNLTPCNRFE